MLGSGERLALAGEPSIDRAFDRLYSFQFEESKKEARAYCEAHPADALGHAALASAFVFSEMNRLQIFNKDLFKASKNSGKPDKRVAAEARGAFEDALNRAKYAGEEALKRDSKDRNALLGLMVATGAERDFAALIEKRYKDSYYAAKASQDYALRLQALDPSMADAWFTRGFSEYLVGSVPAMIRWLMKIDQVSGDRNKGIELMRKCAQGGKYLRPFAQILLASIYQKDKRMKECREMLEAFAAQYPENAVIRSELAKLPKSQGL